MKRFIATSVFILLATAATATTHWRNAFDLVLRDYEPIRIALASGTLDGVAEHAESLLEELRHVEDNITARHAGVRRGTAVELHKELPAMIEAAARLARATTLDEARDAFQELSRGLALWHGFLEKPHKAVVVTCPEDGEVWIQSRKHRDTIVNPYEPDRRDRCTTAPHSS